MNSQEIIDHIRHNALPLRSSADLQPLVDAIGHAKFVLLGEASHGTSEFYTWRIELSKLLIAQKGFNFVAVEGDWPSCYHVNRYVKQYKDALPNAQEVMKQFNRWPTWMWANQEVLQWVEWLRMDNQQKDQENKVGFYGLDMYSLWESMEEIIRHLKNTYAPEDQIALAEKAFTCFEPYSEDGQHYGFNAWSEDAHCADEVVELLKGVQRQHHTRVNEAEAESVFSNEMNALVAVNAERYYRSMIGGGPDSWNIRDRHMTEALQKLTDFHGEDAKAIVWEHNTHIGDARATDMIEDGMVNVGQLVRELYGEEQVFAVGFGSFEGTVIAANAWAAPTQIMKVPQAARNSWEHLFHEANASDQLLIFEADTDVLMSNRGHRAIGVVYHANNERGNYVPTMLSARYDAFIYFEQTHALRPLPYNVLEPIPIA